jgi:hypothetical protein
MSIHDFGVFDLRYRYRSISAYFLSDDFVFDVSIFRYRYRFRAYHFRIVFEEMIMHIFDRFRPISSLHSPEAGEEKTKGARVSAVQL